MADDYGFAEAQAADDAARREIGYVSGIEPELTPGIFGAPVPFGTDAYEDVSGVDERIRRFRRAENEIRRLSADVANQIGSVQGRSFNEFLDTPAISSQELELYRNDFGQLRNLRSQILGQDSLLDAIPGQLINQAGAGQRGAVAAGVRAAQLSGGGRAGLSRIQGGGARRLGERVQQQAAVQTTSNLAQNLTQAQVNTAALRQQNAAQVQNIDRALITGSAGLERALFNQQFQQRKTLSDIQEQRLTQLLEPFRQLIPTAGSLAGTFSADKKTDTERFRDTTAGIANIAGSTSSVSSGGNSGNDWLSDTWEAVGNLFK